MPLKRASSDHDLPLSAFFPEVIGIGLMVILTPLYALRITREGHGVYAGLLMFTAITGSVAFASFMRKGRRWGAWLTMVGILLLYMFVAAHVPVRV